MITINLPNEETTLTIAKIIGELAEAGDVIVLSGNLGAGKTTFTKGIAIGLAIDELIKSPTYTLIREYHTGRIPLYHMDVYRIDSDADELGLEEYFEGDGLSVVEWGEQILEELPDNYIKITLHYETESARKLEIQAIGQPELYQKIVDKWQKGEIK